MTYLLPKTTNRPLFPFTSAQIDQLLPNRSLRFLRKTIIRTWQLSTKERLFPAMTTDSTATLLVYLCFSFSEDR